MPSQAKTRDAAKEVIENMVSLLTQEMLDLTGRSEVLNLSLHLLIRV